MAQTFSEIQEHPSSNRIFIVGGGIVGAALAFYLSEAHTHQEIILLDRSLKQLLGSTGHAPGLVGQLNESPILTRLAKDTVREYASIPGGFDAVGGLEIASSASGVEALNRRLQMARASILPAEIVSPDKAVSLAPDFIEVESVKGALFFSSDGTANSEIISSYFYKKAKANGVIFLEVAVDGFETAEKSDGSQISTILTSKGPLYITSSVVILATGIWTHHLALDHNTTRSITKAPLPIIPVAHPYTFTSRRPQREGAPYPFVRWPESHVYARDHGEVDGLGSYDHVPKYLEPANSAIGPWPTDFEDVLLKATATVLKNGDEFLIKNSSMGDGATSKWTPFNGIFAMTPDSLPLAGKASAVDNMWLCAAIWVTTAAGTAKLIARQVLGRADENTAEDNAVLKALDPDRFRGKDPEMLTLEALGKYNDIYNSKTKEGH